MKRGFTLIELVIVVVVLIILAATALPRFLDLSAKAKESAARGSLDRIRAAIAIKYASNVACGSAGFPDNIYESLFADGIIPKEPYSNSNSVEVVAAGPPTKAKPGWRYASETGQVWINNPVYSDY